MTPIQALQLLFDHAIQSRLLPPAALPDLQKATQIIEQAIKQNENEPVPIKKGK